MQDSDYGEYIDAAVIDELVARVKAEPELYTATDVVRMLESI